jgi:guanosine-3',5'-bis(diphosphate) 3'-pyrophosphohydrolase
MNPKLVLAIKIATEAHVGQTRFDKVTPYITHPLRVADMFSTELVGLKEIAVLHDVLEDTDVTAQDLLKQGVSPWVVTAVVALTKLPGEDYMVYLARVKSNMQATQVKVRDILDNLSDSPTPNMVKKYASALKFLLT